MPTEVDVVIQMDGLVRNGLTLANILIMFGIGIGLRPRDFGGLASKSRPLLAGLAGHYLFLPALGFLVAWGFGAHVELAAGFVLLAACPSASASNALTWLARGNVALAVTLTAISALLTLLTIPLLLALALHVFAGESRPIRLPVANMVGHLALLVLLPVASGMLVRRFLPRFGMAAEPWLNRLGLVLLLAVIGAILARHWGPLSHWIGMLAPAVAGMCTAALGGGYVLGKACGTERRDAITISMEVGMQNCMLALLVAYNVLQVPAIGMPAAVYGVLMYPLALAFVFAFRRTTPDTDPAAAF